MENSQRHNLKNLVKSMLTAHAQAITILPFFFPILIHFKHLQVQRRSQIKRPIINQICRIVFSS
jgi:hypothetical protein